MLKCLTCLSSTSSSFRLTLLCKTRDRTHSFELVGVCVWGACELWVGVSTLPLSSPSLPSSRLEAASSSSNPSYFEI